MFLLQYPCLRTKTAYKIRSAEKLYGKLKEVDGDGEEGVSE